MNIENMKPGDSVEKTVNVYNNGTLDFGSLKMSLDNIQDDSGLLGGIDATVTYVANAGTANESSTTLDTVKANSIAGLDLINGEDSRLLSGNTGSIVITFSLPADAGNEYQGLSTSSDMAFDAGQVQ